MTDPDTGGTTEAKVKDQTVDIARRQFFRTFSRGALGAAVQLAGTAAALQLGPARLADGLLSIASAPSALGRDDPDEAPPVGAADHVQLAPARRKPFRVDDTELLIVDQRQLPEAVCEIRCVTSSDAAMAIRAGAIRGGPAAAVVAGYGVWLAASAERVSADEEWKVGARRAAEEMRLAAGLATVDWAVAIVLAAIDDPRAPLAGVKGADWIRTRVDSLAHQLRRDSARIGRLGASTIPQPVGRATEVLTLDSCGPSSEGDKGMIAAIMHAMAAQARPVRAWMLESGPGRSGSRLGVVDMAAAGIPVTAVSDGAAGWLLANHPIDAVVVIGDRVAADGSTTAVIGTYSLAWLARAHGIPFLVVAPRGAFEAARAPLMDADPYDSSPAGAGHEWTENPAIAHDGPLQDVTPGHLISGILTSGGLLTPPLSGAIAATTIDDLVPEAR